LTNAGNANQKHLAKSGHPPPSSRTARLYRGAADHLLRFFLVYFLRSGFASTVSPNLLHASALASQPAPAQAPPILFDCLDVVTPALPHGRSCAIEAQQIPQIDHLRVIPRSSHPVYPCALSVLEQKFPAHLLHVAALQRILAGSETLEYRLHRVDQHVGVHVFGLGAELKRPCHAQNVVELARGVGVDGKGTRCRLRVHGNQFRPPAADDCYESGCGQSKESVGGDGGREGAQEFLAVLANVSACFWCQSLPVLTPQKKWRMKMISCRGATCGALYSSLKGRLCPCASSTSRSPTRSRSFSVGMSLLTSIDPSNSSCPFWSIGVWLEGENGGVERPGASRDVDTLGSALGADSEGGGEGGRATAEDAAGVVVIGGSAEPVGLLSVVSILAVSVL
jgi:hypothetical protein